MFPGGTHPSRDERSLTVRGPVRGSPRRARSFGDFAIKSREKRGFARHFLFRTTFGVRLRSRLGRLVCALLRFSERPRTIEVQRTTSSPQNHRKSLAQYSVVLFI